MFKQAVGICIAVKLISQIHPRKAALGQGMLLHRLHGINHIKCGIDVVVALLERALVLGIPKRHNTDIQNPRMHISPSERFLQFEAIVITRSKHDLSIELDARIEQPLEHLNAMRRMLSDHFAAHFGRDAVQQKGAKARYGGLGRFP